jgi:hypothetical protein
MKHQFSINGLKGVAEGSTRGRKPSRNWEAEREAIVDMMADGIPVATIASHYKVETSALYRQLAKLGIQTPNQCVLREIRHVD